LRQYLYLFILYSNSS